MKKSSKKLAAVKSKSETASTNMRNSELFLLNQFDLNHKYGPCYGNWASFVSE